MSWRTRSFIRRLGNWRGNTVAIASRVPGYALNIGFGVGLSALGSRDRALRRAEQRGRANRTLDRFNNNRSRSNPNAPGDGIWPYGNARRAGSRRGALGRFLRDTGGYLNVARLMQIMRDATKHMAWLRPIGMPAVQPGYIVPGSNPCIAPCGPYNVMVNAGSCVLVCGDRYVLTPTQFDALEPGVGVGLFEDDGTLLIINPYPRLRAFHPATVPEELDTFTRFHAPRLRQGLLPAALPQIDTEPAPVAFPRRWAPLVYSVDPFLPTEPVGTYDAAPRPVLQGAVVGGVPVSIAPPGVTPDAPPSPYTRERKGAAERAAAVAGASIAAMSEIRDFVGALYAALPRNRQTCRRGDTACQAAVVYSNLDALDVNNAVMGVLFEAYQDRVFGQVYGRANRWARRHGLGPGVNNFMSGYYLRQSTGSDYRDYYDPGG